METKKPNMEETPKSLFAPNGEEGKESMDKSEGLISIPESHLAYSLEAEVGRLEKNIELFTRIKTVSLKLTKPSDWADMGGSPYLMERGAENIAIAWGLDITVEKPVMEWAQDDKGKYYIFTVKGQAYARKLGRIVEDIGTCSQRDKFFGMVGGKFRAVEDIDMTSVQKKAVTNLYGRLIKRCCGLTNLTFDDLRAAGLDISKMGKVEYRKDQKKAEAQLSEKTLEKRQEIKRICLELGTGDMEAALANLRKFSGFKSGDDEVYAKQFESLKTEKWINSTYACAKKEYDATVGGEGAQNG